MSAPPIGGSPELEFDTASFIAPGAARASTPATVPMGGAFVAGRRLVFAGTLQLEFQADGNAYAVLAEIQTSIDAGGSWQTAGSSTPLYVVETGETLRVIIEVLGQLDFTVAPTGDDVLLRLQLTNDGASGSGVIVPYSVGAPGNPRLNFTLATAA